MNLPRDRELYRSIYELLYGALPDHEITAIINEQTLSANSESTVTSWDYQEDVAIYHTDSDVAETVEVTSSNWKQFSTSGMKKTKCLKDEKSKQEEIETSLPADKDMLDFAASDTRDNTKQENNTVCEGRDEELPDFEKCNLNEAEEETAEPEFISSVKSKKHKMLLVGEGNFSYAASIVQKSMYHIVATCFRKPDIELDEFTKQNIKLIKKYGGDIYMDVDATDLESHSVIGKMVFDSIIFNFPHIDGKMNISLNRNLLDEFFQSASKILTRDGEINVSLLYGQSGTGADDSTRAYNDTWQIVENAATSDLYLHNCHPFHVEDYEIYKPHGYRGGSKPFRPTGAFTFVFCIGLPLNIPKVQPVDDFHGDVDWLSIINKCFEKNIEDIEGYMIQEAENPINVILSKLEDIGKLNCWGEPCKDTFIRGMCHLEFEHMLNKHAMFCDREERLRIFLRTHEDLAISLLNLKLMPNNDKACDYAGTVLMPNLSASENIFWKPYHVIFTKKKSELFSSRLFHLLGPIFRGKAIKLYMFEWFIDAKFVNKEIKTPTGLVATFEEKNICGYKTYYKPKFVVEAIGNHTNRSDKSLLCGVYGKFQREGCIYYFLTIDTACLAMLYYQVFDERILYSLCSYMTNFPSDDVAVQVFRPACLHAPKYELHSSFWVKDDFKDSVLLLFVTTHLSEIIEKVELLEVYKLNGRESFCFKFIYCCLDKPMSKEKAIHIHYTSTVVLLCNMFHMVLR